MKTVLISGILFLISVSVKAQCSTIGQTPATAFPVCGTDTFTQTTVPACNNGTVQTFCNDGVGYQALNPFWYQFTCFQSGTLGFLITPAILTDD
ncbi:MAG TPA: hypothetical protein VKT28_04585, partial [Puia sp.]|nr:hypothetical protein [Puia sp.]